MPSTTSKAIVLITGANQGIGFETAKSIARLSSEYHVIVGSRSEDKGQRAVLDLEAQDLKGSVSYIQLDVTNQPSVASVVNEVKNKFGRLDVLINNAGVSPQVPNLEERLRLAFETNTIAPALVTEAFLPLLKQSHSGAAVIHISSNLGSLALAEDRTRKNFMINGDAYRMSKAALNMLAICQGRELESADIKVFAFDPGYTVSNLTGEEGRKARLKNGAGRTEDAGDAIAAIVSGERDADAGKFLHAYGLYPW